MKTACIYHSQDLDGWMSAAIVKHWFSKTYPKYDGVDDLNENSHSITPPDEETTGERLAFLGWNYGQPIPNLSGYDKVIMCDISFSMEEMEKLCDKLGNQFIWIDHHISAIKGVIDGTHTFTGLRDTDFAACELTWMYFFDRKESDEMPEIVRLLGRYDCFGHKGTDEEQKVLEFQYGARAFINDYKSAYDFLTYSIQKDSKVVNDTWKHGQAIYSYLCTEAKQIYKNGFDTFFDYIGAPAKGWKPNAVRFICINRERFNPINFGIDYHKDGYDGCACFHYADGMWKFSLYNDNGEVDCSAIAKQFGGGGHKGASGFVTNDVKKFLVK